MVVSHAEEIMKRGLSAYLLLPLLLLSFNANSAIHKWTDDSGRVHYSDQEAPEDTQSTTLGNKPQDNTTAASGIAAASVVGAPKSLAEREMEFKKNKKAKMEAEEKAATQQKEADAKQKYCLEVRSSLKSMEDNPRIVTYDANGERSYLDDGARQLRMQEARAAIESTCSQ